MQIIRRMWIAGKTIMIKESPKRKSAPGQKRAPKVNMTSEKVWNANLNAAIFKLTLALNNNFKPGDHHLQLTYKEEPSADEAKKDRERFVRKLKRECKKAGLELKWIMVTERKQKRIHHHVVCSNVPVNLITKCWPHGIVFHNPLWDNPNYADLANYLLKEAARGFEADDKIFARRYTTSRNIVMPECQEQELSRIDLEAEPEAFKGYYIDGEVERYEHEITKLTCRKYIQVSLTEEPRIKKWYRGTTVPEERINWSKLLREAYTETQTSFELGCEWERAFC